MKNYQDTNQVNEMDDLRLESVALSTRSGMIDRGFPKTMKRLETRGLVIAKSDGFQATALGFEHLAKKKRDENNGKMMKKFDEKNHFETEFEEEFDY